MKTANKISKKKGKQLATRSQRTTDQRLGIGSPNVSAPSHHSPFYEKYRDQLEDPDPNIMKGQLTAENYRERFHHLLCWEEQEHYKQLTERYTQEGWRFRSVWGEKGGQ